MYSWYFWKVQTLSTQEIQFFSTKKWIFTYARVQRRVQGKKRLPPSVPPIPSTNFRGFNQAKLVASNGETDEDRFISRLGSAWRREGICIYLIYYMANPNVKLRMFYGSSRMWDTLGLYLSDVGGPNSSLARLRADGVTIAVVEEAFIPCCVEWKYYIVWKKEGLIFRCFVDVESVTSFL